MKKVKERFGRSGSAMIMAMIVLINALLIVVSITMISVAERKMSSKFKSSTPAFEAADSGVEWAMNIYQTSSAPDLDSAFGAEGPMASDGSYECPDSLFGGSTGCKVYLLDGSNNVIASGSSPLSAVNGIRSIGTNGAGELQVNRAVETAVAAGDGPGSWDCELESGTNNVSCADGRKLISGGCAASNPPDASAPTNGTAGEGGWVCSDWPNNTTAYAWCCK